MTTITSTAIAHSKTRVATAAAAIADARAPSPRPRLADTATAVRGSLGLAREFLDLAEAGPRGRGGGRHRRPRREALVRSRSSIVPSAVVDLDTRR